MSRSNSTNGLRRQLEDRSQINWRKMSKAVRNLRQRIFLARKLGNWRKLRSLQKLMLRSRACLTAVDSENHPNQPRQGNGRN